MNVVPADLIRGGVPLRVGDNDRLRLAGLDVEVIASSGRTVRRVSYRVGDRVFVGDSRIRDDAGLLALPSDLLVYRSHPLRGTHFGLLGLEAGSTLMDRECWSQRTGRPLVSRTEHAPLPRRASAGSDRVMPSRTPS